MTRAQVHAAVARALEGRHLLEHPFYRRWEAGELGAGELPAYAEQYRVIEEALPQVLEHVASSLDDGEARDKVLQNLADECSVPMAHVDLFAGFATAVGAKDAVATTDATRALVALQLSAAASGPVAGLGTLAAYEMQAGAIASSKAAGLKTHYGLADEGTRFWDLHATMEDAHAGWSIDALGALDASEEEVFGAARAAADAWWAFLDERESLAPALATC